MPESTCENQSNNVEDKFYERLRMLSENGVLQLNDDDTSAGINNVVQGFNKMCLGAIPYSSNGYYLFYVSRMGEQKELTGYVLTLEYKMPIMERFEMVNCLSKLVAHDFEADQVITFNSFQLIQRNMFEKLGYMTVNDYEWKMITSSDSTVILPPWCKGFIYLPRTDIVAVYRWLFGHNTVFTEIPRSDMYVYLMVNEENGRIKIGHSVQPSIRERTLQSKEPRTNLIAYWEAPRSIETELHRLYRHKKLNIRGEWFSLRMKDLYDIKSRMLPYVNT